MTVGELLDRIDSREIPEWMAYERVAGPLGAARQDALFAQLMTLLANVNRPKNKRPYKTEQFVPKWDPDAPPERKPEMSPDEMLRAVRKIHKTMTGGKAAKSGNAG